MRARCRRKLIDPNLQTALDFMEEHLARHHWFAGEDLSMADFQMSFAGRGTAVARCRPGSYRRICAYRHRVRARPAYQRALAKGGPAIPSF